MKQRPGQLIVATLLALFSAGWIAPAYLTAEILRNGLRRLAINDDLSHGQSYFEDAASYLTVSCVWLALVVGLWAFLGARRLLFSSADDGNV